MSTVPVAIPSLVPQAIFYLAAQASWEGAVTACSLLEGVFYSLLKPAAGEPGKFIQKLRAGALEQIDRIQAVFNLMNVGVVGFYGYKLVEALQTRLPFVVATLGTSPEPFSVVAAIGAAFVGGVFVWDRFSKNPTAPTVQRGVEISETLSTQQKIAKALHVTKLVLNVGLACFAQNRLIFALGLVGTGYSLLKNANIRWLDFTRSFQNRSPEAQIQEVKARYRMLAISGSKKEEQCAICLEANTDLAFCANHVFHKTCMAQQIVEKSDQLLNRANFTRIRTEHTRNGYVERVSYHYAIEIPETNLPNCPTCRTFPPQNHCEMSVQDREQGSLTGHVIIERPPTTYQAAFEKLYAVYNVVQAGLSFLQKYPELATMIFKIQEVMLITDFIGLAATTYYLCKKVKEKLKITPENNLKFNIVAAVVVVAAVALSYGLMLQIQAYVGSTLILKEVLSQLPMISGVQLAWGSPWTHQAIQTLLISRTVASTALSFFSTHRLTGLLSALAQLLSLGNLSQLRWLQFTQSLDFPLKGVVASGGYINSWSLNTATLQKLDIQGHFMVSSSCASSPSHLQSIVQSISKYMSKLLDKSSWDRYWRITNTNYGSYRTLEYSAKLQQAALDPCRCTLLPNLTHLSMSALDAVYGSVAVRIS